MHIHHSKQTDLFADGVGDLAVPPVEQPEIHYITDLVENHQEWFEYLKNNMQWNKQFQSRHTITFGASYHYQQKTRRDRPMPEFLGPLCKNIETAFHFLPNNCLINSYPTGNHYISFHSDQDMEMKDRTGVVIISLGAMREMAFRNITNPAIKHYYPLAPGSAIFMTDQMQLEWQHGIPRQQDAGHRISLSFRSLISTLRESEATRVD